MFRLLRASGRFITQQVGGSNDIMLNWHLGGPLDFGMRYWTADYAANELGDAGLTVHERHEDFPTTRFFDIGAIIYYLNAASWQVPGFSTANFEPQLRDTHRKIQRLGFLDVESHRFLLSATKPD